MALPAQTQAQKLKPLFIALGVIGLLFAMIAYAPGFIRSLV
jgi:hypothetical protein